MKYKMMRERKRTKILLCILAGFVMVAAFGAVVMLLWNWLVPDLFSGPQISFWQALGVLILSKILFGGFHGKGGGWKNDCRQRMQHITPEEKQKLRHRFMCKWDQNDPSDDTREEKSDV